MEELRKLEASARQYQNEVSDFSGNVTTIKLKSTDNEASISVTDFGCLILYRVNMLKQ